MPSPAQKVEALSSSGCADSAAVRRRTNYKVENAAPYPARSAKQSKCNKSPWQKDGTEHSRVHHLGFRHPRVGPNFVYYRKSSFLCLVLFFFVYLFVFANPVRLIGRVCEILPLTRYQRKGRRALHYDFYVVIDRCDHAPLCKGPRTKNWTPISGKPW